MILQMILRMLMFIQMISAPAPWYSVLKKFFGKKETDKDFQDYMTPFWAKAGLPSFKGLVGSKRAWCALALVMSLSVAGYRYAPGNASAISFDKVGQGINWKVNGIPQGAIVRINHVVDCKSGSNDHVTFANGDCAPSDLLKPGAYFAGLGGNQGDTVKVSSFPVKHICAVRWPDKDAKGNPVPLPAPVTKSVNCNSTASNPNEPTK